MSINSFQVTAGASVTRVIQGFDSGQRTTEVTIRGRTTGVVQIRIKSRAGDRLLPPTGESTIDLATGQTLLIEGTAVTEIQIDDTGNTGATLSVDVESY